MRFTILGAGGFIGGALVRALRLAGADVIAPARDEPLPRAPGHVIFCIGLTADFRRRLIDTMDAHVGALLPVLRSGAFDSLLYLSSTRVYLGAAEGIETARIAVDPADPSDLYNLSKLAGESLCLTHANPAVRVARLSNVYGVESAAENFLASLVRDAVGGRDIVLSTAADSVRDYIAVEDVVAIVPRIAASGRERLYNVAAGRSVASGTICAQLSTLTGVRWTVTPEAPTVRFPDIRIDRLISEFGFAPLQLNEQLPVLVEGVRSAVLRNTPVPAFERPAATAFSR